MVNFVDKPIVTTPNPKRKKQFCKKSGHIKTTSFVCILCNKNFTSFAELDLHIKDRKPCKENEAKCPICDKLFITNSRLKSHMLCHEEKTKYPCDYCGKLLPSTIALYAHHSTMHTEYIDALPESAGFLCKICGRQFANKVQVTRHINSHIHMTTKLCHICGKSYSSDSALEAHSVVHQAIKPFSCKACGKMFKNDVSLLMHQITHQAYKAYMCDVCGKAFYKGSNLKEHLKAHKRESSVESLQTKDMSKFTLTYYSKTRKPKTNIKPKENDI